MSLNGASCDHGRQRARSGPRQVGKRGLNNVAEQSDAKAAEISDRVREIAEARGLPDSEVFEERPKRSRSPGGLVLAQYLDGDAPARKPSSASVERSGSGRLPGEAWSGARPGDACGPKTGCRRTRPLVVTKECEAVLLRTTRRPGDRSRRGVPEAGEPRVYDGREAPSETSTGRPVRGGADLR